MIALSHTVNEFAHSAHAPVHRSTVTYLAEPNTSNLTEWIRGNGAVTIIAIIACAILLGALKGNVSKVVTVGGLTVVGILFVVLAANQPAQDALGAWALSLLNL